LKLKDKTYNKFLEFFEKVSKKHDEDQFEIAYSEIQRETGVASITLKKALKVLEDDKVIEINQGRNTRYGKIRYLNKLDSNSKDPARKTKILTLVDDGTANPGTLHQIKNMSSLIEQLRQRVRTQEMTISVILDRLADLEDRVHR
jgi:DNA-binding GntR family transcriptional regulator